MARHLETGPINLGRRLSRDIAGRRARSSAEFLEFREAIRTPAALDAPTDEDRSAAARPWWQFWKRTA